MTVTIGPRPVRLRREVAVLMAGTAAGQLAVVASTPLLTRLFEPHEVGTFGAFSALESILVVVACLRFDQAVSLARSDREARPLLRLAVLAAAGTAVLVTVVAAVVPASWRDAVGVDELTWFPLLLGATVLLDAVGQALMGWAVRRRDLSNVAQSRALLGCAQAGGQVGLGAVGAGSGGLAIGYLVGRAAAVVRLARGVLPPAGTTPDVDRLQAIDLPPMVRWRYPVFSMPAALLNAGALQVPILLVAARYDAAAVGALVLATRLAAAPMQLAGQSVTQALTARLAELPDPVGTDLRPQVRSASIRLAVAGAVVALPLVLLGPTLFGWALGDEWRIAGRFAQLLAPATALQLVVAPLAVVLAVKGRQAVQLAWDACRLLAVVAAVLLPAAAGASALGAVAALGAVLAATYLVLLGLVWRVSAAQPPS